MEGVGTRSRTREYPMPRDERQWKALGEAWGTYRDAVEAWLEVVPDPVADPAVIDVLTHELIAEHNEWSEGLGAILRATHRH